MFCSSGGSLGVRSVSMEMRQALVIVFECLVCMVERHVPVMGFQSLRSVPPTEITMGNPVDEVSSVELFELLLLVVEEG